MTNKKILAARPFHIRVHTRSAVVVTRGTVSVQLEGDDVLPLLRQLCDAAIDGTRSREEVLLQLPASLRQRGTEIVELLVSRRLFTESDVPHPVLSDLESPLDIFHWHFGLDALQPDNDYRAAPVAVVGVNHIGVALVRALRDSGFQNITAVDDPFLRRADVETRELECDVIEPIAWARDHLLPGTIIAACSDTGAETILREWNRASVRAGTPFLPVLLRSMVGQVGPLVIPGDTACFECKIRRESTASFLELDTREAMQVENTRGAVSAFHPSMGGVLAQFAAMELVKFLGFIPAYTAGVVFDVNLLRPELVSRRVLKLPACPVCSDVNDIPVPSIVRVQKTEGGR